MSVSSQARERRDLGLTDSRPRIGTAADADGCAWEGDGAARLLRANPYRRDPVLDRRFQSLPRSGQVASDRGQLSCLALVYAGQEDRLLARAEVDLVRLAALPEAGD